MICNEIESKEAWTYREALPFRNPGYHEFGHSFLFTHPILCRVKVNVSSAYFSKINHNLNSCISGPRVDTIPSWNYWWGLLQPFCHQEDTNQRVTRCNCLFYFLLNSEPHFVEAHYSLAGVATTVYVRRCTRPLIISSLFFDRLWASLMLADIILDLLDISLTHSCELTLAGFCSLLVLCSFLL